MPLLSGPQDGSQLLGIFPATSICICNVSRTVMDCYTFLRSLILNHLAFFLEFKNSKNFKIKIIKILKFRNYKKLYSKHLRFRNFENVLSLHCLLVFLFS